MVETLTINDLIDRMVYRVATEEWYIGECDDCPAKNLTEILASDTEYDLDEECSWTNWKNLDQRFDLQRVTGSLDSLLDEIEEQWKCFLLHSFCNRQQREYIVHLREHSSEKT